MREPGAPRLLAIILLLVSLAMLVPLWSSVAAMLRGEAVSTASWMVPIVILATGAALTFLLSKRAVTLQLFLPAMALWLTAAGYFFFTR